MIDDQIRTDLARQSLRLERRLRGIEESLAALHLRLRWCEVHLFHGLEVEEQPPYGEQRDAA